VTRVERIALDAAKAASKALECTMDFKAIARLAAALVPYVDSYGSKEA
jgi:hypothetical protein